MPSLIRRSNGFYYVIYHESGRQKWISTHTRDPKEAGELYQSMKPTLARRRVERLVDLKGRVLEYVELNYRPATLCLYKIAFDKFLGCVGNRPLRFITPSDVETFKDFLTKDVSKVSANDYVRTVKAGFNIGLHLNLITSNPFKGCKLFRIAPVRPTYLTMQEFNRLLQSIDDRHFADLVLFAALTGMRRGELTHVRWAHVDLRARLIHIQNSEEFTVKAMRPRTIPMNQDAFNLLSSLPKETEHVFVDGNGKPYRPETVTQKFKRTVRKCGLPDKVHLHSLRHSYASWLLQSETPLAEIQKLLGHASISTTMIYAHLEHEHLRSAAEKIRLSTYTPNGPEHLTPPQVQPSEASI